jgi:cytosine/adenosine deaminase-related metal-dependent hydrolase
MTAHRARANVPTALATILQGGTVIEFEPTDVEVADLRVQDGRIVARGRGLEAEPGDEVVDVRGKVVMPGLVCGHQHFHHALLRGAPALAEGIEGYQQQLEKNQWKFENGLDLDAVQMSATVGGLEAIACGTTTVFDQHASPRAVTGSLIRVARGLNEIGLRAVLSYAVTDRHGAKSRDEAIAESVSFQKKARGRFRGAIGAHASFTISAEGLKAIGEAVKSTGAAVHLDLAEDPSDERLSFERYGQVPVARLAEAGLFTPKSLVAHAVHLAWAELSQVISTGAWLVHNARANMNSQVGYAPAGKFGARAMFGSAGLSADMFAEAQVAFLRSRDAGQPIDVLKYLANGQRFASEMFGLTIGPLREGAVADLCVLDYPSPTPIGADNLAEHFLFGFSSRHVEAVMIDGTWRLWGRRPTSVTIEDLSQQAQSVAVGVWARAAE